MTASREDAKFQQLVRKIDTRSSLLRTWMLEGGVSARVTALEIERPDGLTEKMIVRQHGEADLKQNPRYSSRRIQAPATIAIIRIGCAEALSP